MTFRVYDSLDLRGKRREREPASGTESMVENRDAERASSSSSTGGYNTACVTEDAMRLLETAATFLLALYCSLGFCFSWMRFFWNKRVARIEFKNPMTRFFAIVTQGALFFCSECLVRIPVFGFKRKTYKRCAMTRF